MKTLLYAALIGVIMLIGVMVTFQGISDEVDRRDNTRIGGD